MDVSLDPYEQKLFQMFKSYDNTNLGLDETSLIKLCNSLELSERSNILVKTLIDKSDDKNGRVNFKSFKEALLNFLGAEMDNSGDTEGTTSSNPPADKNLTFTDEESGNGGCKIIIENTNAPGKGPDSPGREISPKLIMGTKKYGRRSRPQSIATDSSLSETDDEQSGGVKSSRVQRSSSHSDMHNTTNNDINSRNRRRPANITNTKLKRCASLPVQKRNFHAKSYNAREHLIQQQQMQQKKIENQEIETNQQQPGGLKVDLKDQKQLASSVESLDIPVHLETVPSNSIIEMWENAAVNEPKMLLTNLGFEDDEVNVEQLIKILEEELRGLQYGETQSTLLKALLALEKAEVAMLQQSVKQLCEENKKLHADNKDANKRSALLAQEIDERHANIEDSTKSEIRQLEQKHAEVIRELTAQMSADRENWSNLNIKLELRIKSLENEEQRLKSEMNTLQEENSALEKDQSTLQKQITELLENNIKLNNEIMSLTDKTSNDFNDGLKENDEVIELIEKISSLQMENTNLRDKNDELTCELENLNMELVKLKLSTSKKSSQSRTSILSVGGESPTGVAALDSSDEATTAAEHASLAMKRRGDSPSKAKLTEESPRTGKLRKCNNDGANNSESETSGDWVALNSELNVLNSTSKLSVKNEEIKNLKEKIIKLEEEIKELKNKQNDDDKKSITTIETDGGDIETLKVEKEIAENRCKDLEQSLEQMQKAYEECEDYWQNKLNDERQIFEKERQIYEDEQNESDKKFAELMEKVREYEEQFSKDGRLSPIEEKDVLEQQYMDLEAEIEEIRHNAKMMFEDKTKEIENLKINIQELRLRLGESVDITQVCNMESGSNRHNMLHDKSDINDSPASSPISYLWNQSTIQAPARDYQNPNWNKKNNEASRLENLTTSETSIFSTVSSDVNDEKENQEDEKTVKTNNAAINPIQKPISSTVSIKSNRSDKDCDDTVSVASSSKSGESHSVASTHSLQKSSILEISSCNSPNGIKEELKRLKFFEVQLREQIKDLALQRDSLVMELQQLQAAKPVLEKAYARAAHPTLIQRVNLLEQKNRHLQTQLRQQQQYTDSIMQQTWQQQRNEVADLRNRLETQGIIMAEQAQRLANSDMLVKDLYVENSHLSATIQRLEQQRSRANLIHQHHQQQQQHNQHKQTSAYNGILPGMP